MDGEKQTMNRTGFKQRGKPLGRSAIKSKRKPVKAVSAKRAEYRRSDEGKAALAYMRAVKQLPCVVCGAYGVDAHHVICDRFGTRKSSDFDVIPLCKSHHQDGPDAIHNGKRSWVEKHGPDHSYIEKTRADVARALG